jgi:hypothetical protein
MSGAEPRRWASGCNLPLPFLPPEKDQFPYTGTCDIIPNSSARGEDPCLIEGYGRTRLAAAKESVDVCRPRHMEEGNSAV